MNARHLRRVSSSTIDSADATVRRGASDNYHDNDNDSELSDNGSSTSSTAPTSSWERILAEARAVSLWSCGAFAMRFGWTVISMAAKRTITDHPLPPILAGCVLLFVPSKVATLQAPGFSFGSPWLLLWVRNRTGIMPNVPNRICEWYMGRMSWKELVAVLPLHVVCVVSTAVLIQRSMPPSIVEITLDPIPYMGYENIQTAAIQMIRDLARETMVTTIFVVSILVLPILLELNRLSTRWILPILLFPIFSISVESSTKMASTLAPNVVLALKILAASQEEDRPLRILMMIVRVAGPILGGIAAGEIMRRYFPDDEASTRSKAKRQ